VNLGIVNYQDDPAYRWVSDQLSRLEMAYLYDNERRRVPGRGSNRLFLPYQFADLIGVPHATANRYAQLCETFERKCMLITSSADATKGTRYFRANYFRHSLVQFLHRQSKGLLIGPHWRCFYFINAEGCPESKPNPRFKVGILR